MAKDWQRAARVRLGPSLLVTTRRPLAGVPTEPSARPAAVPATVPSADTAARAREGAPGEGPQLCLAGPAFHQTAVGRKAPAVVAPVGPRARRGPGGGCGAPRGRRDRRRTVRVQAVPFVRVRACARACARHPAGPRGKDWRNSKAQKQG